MGYATKLGIWTLGAALFFALAGDYLLRGVPWGLNVTLLGCLLVSFVLYPVWRGGVSAPGGGRRVWVFAFFAVALAVCASLRASPVLITVNVLGSLAALLFIVVAWRWESGPRGVSDVVVGALSAGVFSLAGPIPVCVRKVRRGEFAPGIWWTPVISVLRGVLIAVPLLLIFGGLLVAADAVFERAVSSIFDFDVADIAGHSILILTLFWLASGYLYSTLISGGTPNPDIPRPRWLSLGLLETVVILGSLNVLFAAFVVVQAGYLFGARAAAGLTYAEYARRGFFELVAVAALVIPLLLAAHWLLRREECSRSRNLTVFRLLVGVMASLVFVMMASALWRMYLYYTEFGLTELRLYTTAFMFWLALVLLFYLAFVLRERRDHFVGWTLVSGFVAILAINALNPDAVIAASNIERFRTGEELDAYYLTRLSEDAAPIVFASLNETEDTETSPPPDFFLDPESENTVPPTLKQAATEQWSEQDDTDWRSWNYSRVRANALAEEISIRNTP